mmetsp:Transcript_9595/g.29697  ORF Transcript_9595/g.29697 Transcript_9595/m.29697 type:complete len:1190 (-) Transcript_9595:44-3613(-)
MWAPGSRWGFAAVLVLALVRAVGSAGGRPCTDSDWRFTLSECVQEEETGRKSRGIFAYGPSDVCSSEAATSRPEPKPLLGVPCHHPCEKGTRLAADAQRRQADGDSQVRLQCQTCEPGRFSLGGGSLYDGNVGDWSLPLPAEMTTFCFYRGTDYEWYAGNSRPKRCLLHLALDLAVQTRPGTWNEFLPDVEIRMPLVIPPGDPMDCEPVTGDSVRGKAVLVQRGVCTFQLKADLLASAGALAVVLYNNEPRAGYFYPSASNQTVLPQIPIFMITMEDGESIRARVEAAAAGGVAAPELHAATSRCSAAGLEAMPTMTPTGGHSGNNSLEFFRDETWDDIEGQRGCASWSTDATGGFFHSGNNLHFHWVYSVLMLSLRFVRDGHLRFRYSVDSESYDGLSFLMDQAERFPKVSRKAPYVEFKIDVPRGPHTFTWIYQKDYSSTAGEDRARLQVLEVVGSSYADLACRSCNGARELDVHGAEACPVCERDHYLYSLGGNSSCEPCPSGFGAPSGSVGAGSCLMRRACGQRDIEVTYSAFEMNGTVRQLVGGIVCLRNETLAVSAWRRPVVCDPGRPESMQLPEEAAEVRACPPCQPYEHRPQGELCEPLVRTCAQGFHSQRELVVAHWYTWPRRFSHEVIGLDGSSRSDDGSSRSHWQLASDASAAVVGSAFGGLDEAEAGHDIARLHLDAPFSSEGNLSFVFEARPAGAWGRAAQLTVNGTLAKGAVLEGPFGRFPLWRVVLPLPPGPHRITWSWRYGASSESEDVDDAESSQLRGVTGLRLLNISAQNVAGAGARGCAPCLAGHEVAPDGSSCRRCPAGHSSAGGGAACAACDSGYAAAEGAAACVACGPGLRSAGAAARCEPVPMLAAKNFVGASTGSQWDLQAIARAWHGNATEGLRPLRVEDRLYYVGLFSPFLGPAGGTAWGTRADAYWWERLPPRASSAPSSPGIGGSAVCEAGSGVASYRSVGESLESLEPVSEGDVLGVLATFTGTCEGTPRRAKVLLRCEAEETPNGVLGLAAAALMKRAHAMGRSPSPSPSEVLQASFRKRPTSARSCDDVEIEWRSQAACPLCRPDDFVPVKYGKCDPRKGQVVMIMARSRCFGGAAAPQDRLEPCGDSGGIPKAVIAAFVVPVALVLCCLGCYVALLRRRYSQYMSLEEDQDADKDTGGDLRSSGSVPASNIGAPTWA